MAILRIENIEKHYRNHTALQGVSLQVPQGAIVGLLGPNGAGKTTLIRLITQILLPDAGQIFFQDRLLAPADAAAIGYLPEERGLYKKMRVGEQLLYLGRLRGLSKKEAQSRIDNWVEKFQLQSWLKKNVGDLSKGMQQKVQFIATVLHQPPLLILDEPFSGFDPINANLIQQEILNLQVQGTTIIFSSHRMESVEELCEYIILINRAQKVLEGKKKDIKAEFKSHTFLIETQEPISTLPEGFEILLPSTHNGEHYQTQVRLLNPMPTESNRLLKGLLQDQIVVGFKEILPSINDIFLQLTTSPSTPLPTP
ncbi:ABC transporter ATP-binding protein [Hugenholtzia roseola]|uniref:ABC transporter ATP-binding protein n=1 Tax=Hugenholtzia roseola TaxID=1002 RepID=UPI000479A0AF|nr:ATP-binding cassette domain-containing protein [Hugenholtzia roseola]